MKEISILLFLFLMITSMCVDAETYNTVYVDGRAPVNIDGDLSDWNFIKAEPEEIEWVSHWSKPEKPRDTNDLSAYFKCFYDSYKLYVAVWITDDCLVFGQEIFEYAWHDDSVEIFFDGDMKNLSKVGFDENDGQIRISADKTGKTILEGKAMLCHEHSYYMQYPYIWESLGVKAALIQNENGYTVEVSIPYKILGWSDWLVNRIVGMNVRILDDDDGGDFDCLLGWVNDPDDKSHRTTEYYGHVAFFEPADISGTDQPKKEGVTEREIVVVIDSPEKEKSYDYIFSVLGTIYRRDYNTAEIMLESCGNKVWAPYMMGMVQRDAGKYAACAKTFSHLANECTDRKLALWAKLQAGIAYRKLEEYTRAINEFEEFLLSTKDNNGSLEVKLDVKQYIAEILLKEGNITQAADKYIEILESMPIDWQPRYLYFLRALVRTGCYNKATEYLNNIIHSAGNKDIELKAKVEIARIYFYKGDYERTIQLCNELLNSMIDSRIALEVHMILLSTEWKKNNK